MSRKSNKKRATVEEEEVPPITAADKDDEDGTTEDESIQGDVQMKIDISEEEVGDATAKQSNDKKTKKKKKENNNQSQNVIPFMDTFYQLSSEDSPTIRSIAARDLIQHCFPSRKKDGSDNDDDVNCKDAAYAITRLMNGLCTGRAASRQGFASCLTSFMKVGYPYLNEIMKEDTSTAATDSSDDDTNSAAIVRNKLLATTDFLTPPSEDKGSSNKKNRFGGGMKGIEARDHAFGRLFGILAIVRSGVLSQSDFPSKVSYNIYCYSFTMMPMNRDIGER